jgi:O-antigen/teichoic acid export membrane protein
MKINNIARNTSFFTAALIIQKIITFLYFTILARNLDPADLGKFYLAISFSSIFLTIIDLGQANLLTREVAKQSVTQKSSIVNTIMAIKLPLIIISSLLVYVLANALDYPEVTRHLIYYSISLMIMDSLATTFFSIIRGYHNLKYESFISVITQLIILGGGVYFIFNGYPLIWIMIAQVIGTLFRFAASLLVLLTKMKISLRPDFNFSRIKSILILTIPFAMYAVYNKLYLYLDTVLLSKLAGDFETGIYQIAFKFIFALQFLPLAFVASLYPAFASCWKEAQNSTVVPNGEFRSSQLTITFERAMNYLSLIALPIALGIFAIAPELINFFKPEYAAGVWPLRISILALVFIFLNYPIGSLLNACDRQKENTRNMGIVMVVSIIANLVLIPRFKALGASATVLFSNILMLILGLWYVPKIIELRGRKLFFPFISALIAAFIMMMVILYIKTNTNLFMVITLGGLFYAILIFLTGAVKVADIKSITKSFLNNK